MPSIACYSRVSTADQNLDRQLESTSEFAKRELGAGLADIVEYRDKSTGTDTSRSGYREMMDAVEAGDIDAVVVHEISRLARSLQDLERTITRVTNEGVEIHFVRDGLSFGDGKESPMHRLQMQMLGAFAEWQARVKQMNTKEGIAARQQNDDYHHGRAPLGFEKEEGELYEGPEYDRVCGILDMVAAGDMSKRRAAKELGTSRRSIGRSLDDRSELYGL